VAGEWIVRNRPRTVEDWVFAPVLAFFGGLAVVSGFFAAVVGWPLTLVVIARERRFRRERRAAAAAEEERELLEEVRRWMREQPAALTSDASDPSSRPIPPGGKL